MAREGDQSRMNMQNMPQASHKAIDPPQGGKARRVSARVRQAVVARVVNGLTGEEAARVAGLSYAGFWKAWKQPHVQALAAETKKAFLEQMVEKEQDLKARSIAVIEELMRPDQPAGIRLKAVELLRRERPQTTIAIQNNVAAPTGYSYPKPDSASIAHVEDASVIKDMDK